MNLHNLMQNGISGIMKSAGKFYLNNPQGRDFINHTLPLIQKSANLRKKQEKNGCHIPPFLIASIASQCNLRCAGCYARAGGSCAESAVSTDLTEKQWSRIFEESASLGVSFVLLAGGEPLMRRDVIEAAARQSEIIFPIFTNGTTIDAAYVQLFDEHRNLIPVFSIEGTETKTDARRGDGVFSKIQSAMADMKSRGVLFGASITVTTENRKEVTTPAFLEELRGNGCGVLFYVEYVPVEAGTEKLALQKEDADALRMDVQALKRSFTDMVILSFPGDEEAMGGCLASGRGFFHINVKGGAEPCPFSPHAKLSLQTSSMLEVLQSEYFAKLRELAQNAGEHNGGCTLFEQEAAVLSLHAQ